MIELRPIIHSAIVHATAKFPEFRQLLVIECPALKELFSILKRDMPYWQEWTEQQLIPYISMYTMLENMYNRHLGRMAEPQKPVPQMIKAGPPIWNKLHTFALT